MQPETLLLEPRQSALTLAGGGKTVLKHAVRGGKPPLKFTLATPYDEIKIDEKTGDVTIDEASLLKEAARAVKQSVASQSQGVPLVDAFRAQKSPMLERAEEILGAKPANLQAAIPISVEVADAESNISRLQYFVLAEAQQAAVLELLAALERERTKARIARENYSNDDRAGRTPVDRAAERNQNDEAAVLKRRLESLEQRLDLITRQLNDLLKKLDKK